MAKLRILTNEYAYSFRNVVFVAYPFFSLCFYFWVSSQGHDRTFFRNLIFSQCFILPACIWAWFFNSITHPYQVHLNDKILILKRKFLQYKFADIKLSWDDIPIILYSPWKTLASTKYYFISILTESDKKIRFHCNHEIVEHIYKQYKGSKNPVWRLGE